MQSLSCLKVENRGGVLLPFLYGCLVFLSLVPILNNLKGLIVMSILVHGAGPVSRLEPA